MTQTAQQLASMYENINMVIELLNDRIEDECDSSDDFDSHYLADEFLLIRKCRSDFEKLIKTLLNDPINSEDIRNELSKLCVEAALRSKPLKIAKFLKSN